MHILVLPSWYPVSADDVNGVFFRDQVLALKAEGHSVGVIAVRRQSLSTLASPSKGGPKFEEDEGVATYRGCIWNWLPGVPYGTYALVRQTTMRIFQRYLQEEGRPDVIHAHSAIYGGVVAEELGRSYGIPVVLTEHSSGFGRGAYRSWQLRLAERAIDGAAERVAVSPALGELLNRQFPRFNVPWRWVPNVVAKRFEGACPAVRSNRNTLRLLNLALMTPNKGQHDLLEAFAKAFPAHLGVELWFGGDGPLRPNLEKRAKQLGLARHVRFLGRVPPGEVPTLLNQIDVMVISSHYETFGVVAAEALMMGRPVVATRSGGPDCIVGPDDGILVSPGDPAALAQALSAMVENLDRYQPMDLANRARLRFGGAAVAAQLSEVYQRVVHERRNGVIQPL